VRATSRRTRISGWAWTTTSSAPPDA
jgi:hypothetical protein